MVLVKSRVGVRLTVSKTKIMVVFKKMNNKMAIIITDKSREGESISERKIVMVHMDRDKKVKWDNMNNKTSIRIENRELQDSNLLLSKYEWMNLVEEKKLLFEEW
jgi:hypothetical protein